MDDLSTLDQYDLFLANIAAGLHPKDAATSVGFSPNTHYSNILRGKEVQQKISRIANVNNKLYKNLYSVITPQLFEYDLENVKNPREAKSRERIAKITGLVSPDADSGASHVTINVRQLAMGLGGWLQSEGAQDGAKPSVSKRQSIDVDKIEAE